MPRSISGCCLSVPAYRCPDQLCPLTYPSHPRDFRASYAGTFRSPGARQDDPCAQYGQNPPRSPHPPLISPARAAKYPARSLPVSVNFESSMLRHKKRQLTSKPTSLILLISNVTSEQNMLPKERVSGARYAGHLDSSLRFAQGNSCSCFSNRTIRRKKKK
jgi:hypothetical protein